LKCVAHEATQENLPILQQKLKIEPDKNVEEGMDHGEINHKLKGQFDALRIPDYPIGG
jgi:hypothetical protein